MERIDATAVRALRAALDTQPVTPGKIQFAWSLAAGPTLARAASVDWHDGTLHVRATSEHWRLELVRSRSTILSRLTVLLGADVVRALTISGPLNDMRRPLR